jgi:PKD repeat protein
MRQFLLSFFTACMVVLAAGIESGQAATAAEVEQWGIFEISLKGPSGGQPYREVQFSARFSQGDRLFVVPGFWDGGDTYRLRFSPPSMGEWRYETKSNVAELNAKTGAFVAAKPTIKNHGPVQVFDKYYLRYADGTPYHQYGTTSYAWTHQTRELQEQTLKTLASSAFNKIRFCIFPKSYVYNKNEPEFFAFKQSADGKFDLNQPDPNFWRHLERRILDLQQLGIEADLILWHPYDRWGFSDMSDEEDDRYLRYCIARLSAFRNVWWSLANEYDFMTDGPVGHRGNKQWEDWDRFFSILQKEDPHQRLRSIHNGRRWYDHTKDWVTHASLQVSDMEGGVRFRAQYGKPVIYDECKYEGDIPHRWGNLTGRDMAQRFWLGTMSGTYVGHAETYRHPQDILWWSKGGVLHGQSPKRIQWLKDFMAQAPAFHELKPLGDGNGKFALAKESEYYLVYCLGQRSQTVQLAGTHPYKVELVDPWEMTVTPVGTASPGQYTFSAPKADVAYRFTPYKRGEKMWPEANIVASVTEGQPPLKVQFASPANGRVEWDFGDGTTSREAKPTHVFEKMGLYAVKLTVTDANGSKAETFRSIAVDRNVSQPILRVGMPEGQESAGVKLHGTVRRDRNGFFHLPEGQPWGWVEVDRGAAEALNGLHSFTIMGWLKPETLKTGSGGNQILFSLKENRAGIDLIQYGDGALRLAVNERTDLMRNDSSNYKLQEGKWTFFAVAYDGTALGDNVTWYLSPPLDTPGPTAVTHDRRSVHNVGAVDISSGPLVIGNVNETLRNAGLHRQFRGGLGGLQIFGSYADGRGALKIDEINSHLQASLSNARPARPRVIVTSDFPPVDVIPIGANYGPPEKRSDPDDVQSMVRLLLYGNDLEIEGLVASAGTLANIAKKQNILDLLDIYDKVDENLRQHDPRYPTADKLRSVTWEGRSGAWGTSDFRVPDKPISELIGPDKDTEASNAIIRVVDRPDPRPVWVAVWGGSCEVAQAIWKVRATRSPAEVERFLSKLRIYLIARQDGTAQWLLDNFPNLFIILAQKTYLGMFWDVRGADPKLADLDWINANIRQGHGPLGAVYPESGANPKSPGQREGDTPTFLHLVSAVRGLNDPEKPDQGGWGGKFVRRDPAKNHWFDDPAGAETVYRWRAESQADFARRADWMKDPPR